MTKAPKKTTKAKDTGLGAGTGDQGGIDAVSKNPDKPGTEKPGQHGNTVKGGPGNPSNKAATDAALGRKPGQDVTPPGQHGKWKKITSAPADPVDLMVNGHRSVLRVGTEYKLSDSQVAVLRDAGVTVEDSEE